MPALPTFCVLSVLHLQLSHRREAVHHGRATAQGWPSLRRFSHEKIVDISYLITYSNPYQNIFDLNGQHLRNRGEKTTAKHATDVTLYG